MNCNDLITIDEIKKLYTFDMIGDNLSKVKPIIRKDECIDSRCPENNIQYSPSISQNTKEVWLDLYANNEPTLLKHCCIVNEYCFTQTHKKVVIIQGITLDEKFRGNGILSTIFQKQKRFYRKKNFSKITLTATNSGLIVWYRLGFKYAQKRDELKILKSLNEYLQEIHGETKKYKSIIEVKPELLFGSKENENFTDWLMRHDINHIKMIMEL
ncbi:MAG: GNAT family N-acetyltransferase [Campylobacterota bacterium]|nr:GNAT family N-acetyltransferase [Campylobacterota bacterium]